MRTHPDLVFRARDSGARDAASGAVRSGSARATEARGFRGRHLHIGFPARLHALDQVLGCVRRDGLPPAGERFQHRSAGVALHGRAFPAKAEVGDLPRCCRGRRDHGGADRGELIVTCGVCMTPLTLHAQLASAKGRTVIDPAPGCGSCASTRREPGSRSRRSTGSTPTRDADLGIRRGLHVRAGTQPGAVLAPTRRGGGEITLEVRSPRHEGVAMTTTEASPMDARDPLARTATARRVGLAVAMLLAPWFIVAAEVGHAAMTLHGGDDLEPSSDLALASEHLTVDRWGSLAALVGALLMVPAVLGIMRLVPVRAAGRGVVAGVPTAAGDG